MLHRFSRATLTPSPWKNGGGVTYEIARSPQPAESSVSDFDWRASIAQISKDGDFSLFTGIDRVIVLLDGCGVQLCSVGSTDLIHRLDTPLQPFYFAGEQAVRAECLGGLASHDFNVMTRRGVIDAEVCVLKASTAIEASQAGLLFAAQGDWRVTGGELLRQGEGLYWDGVMFSHTVHPLSDAAALISVRFIRL